MKKGSTASMLLGLSGLLLASAPTTRAGCPMRGLSSMVDADLTIEESTAIKVGNTIHEAWNPNGHPYRKLMQADADGDEDVAAPRGPGEALPALSQTQLDDIKAELETVLTNSQDFFPADFGGANGGNYLGLFIRFAWHCSGSYRSSDGRGGCDGGRIRFLPEFGWEDNVQLDKALTLLTPTAEKFSDIISFGDLIILMGNVAIESSGGPILGFCGGRIDDTDGTASLPLGPSTQQEALASCVEPFNDGDEEAPGDCPVPLGPSVVGLIYVEPNGPGELVGDAVASAEQIRRIMPRMSFVTDREQVALIGAGHILGKVHGACPDGAGPGPLEAPDMPYVGTCDTNPLEPGVTGVGTGLNTFSSGFDGPWTENPTVWDNDYFKNLLEYRWELGESPGGNGAMQWFPFDMQTGEPGPDIIMLTSDIAFIKDSAYLPIVEEFANDIDAMNAAFETAWYKVTTQDMGPASRCQGTEVPPQQVFQDPLPEPSVQADADLAPVEQAIRQLVSSAEARGPIGELGFLCGKTFRTTSWVGGCDGGRIAMEPQISFSGNEGVQEAITLLQPLHEEFSDIISMADLIVMASTIAVEVASGPTVPFCPGRVDAESGSTDTDLSPRTYYNDPVVALRDTIDILGVSAAEWVALQARPMPGQPEINNDLFRQLVSDDFEPVGGSADPITGEFQSVQNPAFMIPVSIYALLEDENTRAAVEQFASDPQSLNPVLGSAWQYLVNADRFDGPSGNVCSGPEFQFRS